MNLRHIVAAADESEVGREAVRAALELASRAGARVTIVQVVPSKEGEAPAPLEQLRRWVEPDLPALNHLPSIAYLIAHGVPGIEIGRIAERLGADLVVLGRKPRTRMTRLLLGDTADAVARRSPVPCLFVPQRGVRYSEMLVAVDGSDRGMSVLSTADEFAKQVEAEVRVLTVERVHHSEPAHLAVATPVARSTRIRSQIRDTLGHEVEIRRGEAAEQILAAVEEQPPDVLVLGWHRGGPAGVIEAGSTARQVIHSARCPVLTVPL